MIEDYGHWVSEMVFEFDEPRELAPGMFMKVVDVSQFMTPEPDITARMVIEALINSGLAEADYDTLMREVTCPDCGMTGMVPAEAMKGRADPQGEWMVRCPKCRDASRN